MEQRNQHIETLNGWGNDIYSKLSWFRQEKVSSASIMVVGCGALGNEVLKNLVLFGVEHLVLVDFDMVEDSNLSRSILYTHEDASQRRLKVDVAAERLRQINPKVQVVPVCGDIEYDVGLGLLRRMDVVIGCVDSRWARYCINRLCMRVGVPWVDGGINGLDGTVRVFVPGKNCYACNLGTEGLKELAHRMPCSGIIRKNEIAGRAPTTPVVASVIGAVQVQEALKLIHSEQVEQGELTSLCGKVFYYEGQHLTTHTANFEAYDDDCPVHEQWKGIKQSSLHTKISVGDAIGILENELHVKELSLLLTSDCFVDYVEDRISGQQTEVLCAGHCVAERIGNDENLCKKSDNDYYQHEFSVIDRRFPYSNLTLGQIGIPAWDVLHVRTEHGDLYVEMKEELQYETLLESKV